MVRVKTNAEGAKKEIQNLAVQQRLIQEFSSIGAASQIKSKGIEGAIEEQEITEKLISAKQRMSEADQRILSQSHQQLLKLNEQEEVYENILQHMDQIARSPEQTQQYLNSSSDEKKAMFQEDYKKLRDEAIENIKRNNELLQEISDLDDSGTLNKKTRKALYPVLQAARGEVASLYELIEAFDELEKEQGELTRNQKAAKKTIEETIVAREREADALTELVENKKALGEIERNEITNALQSQNGRLEESAALYDRIIQELAKYKNISREAFTENLNNIRNQKEELEKYRKTLATQNDLVEKQAMQMRSVFSLISSISAISGGVQTFLNPNLDA